MNTTTVQPVAFHGLGCKPAGRRPLARSRWALYSPAPLLGTGLRAAASEAPAYLGLRASALGQRLSAIKGTGRRTLRRSELPVHYHHRRASFGPGPPEHTTPVCLLRSSIYTTVLPRAPPSPHPARHAQWGLVPSQCAAFVLVVMAVAHAHAATYAAIYFAVPALFRLRPFPPGGR
jgi:hypothetical protein